MADDFIKRVSDHMGNPANREYDYRWLMRNIREASESSERSRSNVKGLSSRKRSKLRIGQMYFFVYDAKHKSTLPYYDRFPFIIPFNQVKGGFMGLNIHYLPPRLRVEFLNSLKKLTPRSRFDADARFQAASYELLKSAANDKHVGACVKRYLSSQVMTEFIEINGDEWHIAASLPLENFRKASKSVVWSDSLRR